MAWLTYPSQVFSHWGFVQMAFKFISNEATSVYAILLIWFFLHLECSSTLKSLLSLAVLLKYPWCLSSWAFLTYESYGCVKAESKGRGKRLLVFWKRHETTLNWHKDTSNQVLIYLIKQSLSGDSKVWWNRD